MVSDEQVAVQQRGGQIVLILVLMEYGLWPIKMKEEGIPSAVLILVLMEYGLWPGDAQRRIYLFWS